MHAAGQHYLTVGIGENRNESFDGSDVIAAVMASESGGVNAGCSIS